MLVWWWAQNRVMKYMKETLLGPIFYSLQDIEISCPEAYYCMFAGIGFYCGEK